MDDRISITLNLRRELVVMLDEIAAELHTKRPGALEVAIPKEYKIQMRRRQAQAFPTAPKECTLPPEEVDAAPVTPAKGE